MGSSKRYLVVPTVVALLALFSSACQSRVKDASELTGEPFFTAINIRYEHPERIYTTNYRVGAMIPVGTKVTMGEIRSRRIHFSTEKGEFTIEFVKKHSKPKLSLMDVFNQYFSRENPLRENGPFSEFTVSEQGNIRKGKIAVCMSKSAVLMAYGYPPSHRTPSLDSDIWRYWESRLQKWRVFFQDGKVMEIQGSKAPVF